jgi:hypothetical protein
MNTFRNNIKCNFSIIPNSVIQDDELSDRARFLFCYMATKPDDWQFYQKPLAKALGYSLETLRKYLDELLESGWLMRETRRGERGRFDTYDYTLLESPYRKNPDTVKDGHGKTPTRKKSVLTNNRPIQNNNHILKNTSTNFAETKFRRETVGEVMQDFEVNGEPLPTKQPRTSTPPEFRATPPKAEKAPNQIYTMFEAYANFCESKGLPMSRNANGHFIMPVKEAAALKSWAKWAAGMPGAGDPLTDWQAFLNAAWTHGDKFIKGNFTPCILHSKSQSIMYAVNKHRIAQKELQDAVMQGGGIDDLLNP